MYICVRYYPIVLFVKNCQREWRKLCKDLREQDKKKRKKRIGELRLAIPLGCRKIGLIQGFSGVGGGHKVVR